MLAAATGARRSELVALWWRNVELAQRVVSIERGVVLGPTAGVDVRTVAGRLGHRNASTTLNVYAHFLEQADRSAADVIGRVIAADGAGVGEC
jgi:site-specific recombinase XerD